MLTRRQLLSRGAVGGAGLLVLRAPLATAAPVVVGVTPKLRKWVEPLPVPPVLDGRGGGKSFTIAARESTTWRFHPSLPPTTTWGYWSDNPAAGLPYLGPTIVATRRPDDTVESSVTVEWRNELETAFLPNDPTLMGAVMPGEPVPIVTHLHGGENHPQFDGTPLQWFTKDGEKGPHYITNRFTYYNEQRASMVWYHDHALGNTRTNVYAGLAGLYFIRDVRARAVERERSQGHGSGPPRAGHPHPRAVRAARRGHHRAPARRQQPAVRLALPHPRARGERHDAGLRGRAVSGSMKEDRRRAFACVLLQRTNSPRSRT
jgi:FtsP/CotA-like multicopper oxidase with cupredoxin domain